MSLNAEINEWFTKDLRQQKKRKKRPAARIEPGSTDFQTDIDTTTLIPVVLISGLSNSHLEKGGEETKESGGEENKTWEKKRKKKRPAARIEPGSSDLKTDTDTTTLVPVVLMPQLSNAYLERGGEETMESGGEENKTKTWWEDRTRASCLLNWLRHHYASSHPISTSLSNN